MAQIHWTKAVSADFNTAADWGGGNVPGSADDAILDAAGGAFTVSTTTSETVNSVQLAANATLSLGGGTAFQAVTGTGAGANAGTINVGNNSTFLVGSVLANNGTIALSSLGNATRLELTATTALTGTGTVVLGDNVNNQIFGLAATFKLTNSSTISGSGALGAGQMTLVNQAKGVINATGTSTQLVLNTGSQTATNSGLIEGTGVAGLLIQNTTVANSGTILAGTGSVVNLQSADIQGGTLTTSGTGAIQAVDRGTTLDGTASTVTNSGVFNVVNNNFAFLVGAINNTGTINVTSGGNDTRLMINAAGATLSGAGKVVLANNGNNSIQSNGAGATLTNVNDTISGGGFIGGSNLAIVNQAAGVINGNGSVALVINSGSGLVSNAGLFEGTGTGGLTFSGETVANTGTILAATGSVVSLQSADIQGGTFATAGTGAIQVVDRGTLLDGTAASVNNTGTFNVTNNNYVYIQGAIANGKAGVINLQSIGNATAMIVTAANATITGGAVVLSDNANNTIQGTVSGVSGSQVASSLVNSTTISGAGLFGNGALTLVNNKTIDATGANALIIDVGGGNFASSSTVTNAGLLEATNPNALAATGGLVLHSETIAGGTKGIIEANGAATHVDLQGATIAGGSFVTANGGAIETFSSDRGSLLDGTANVVNNTGVLNVTNNAWLYLQGTINNTGSINLQSVGNDTRLRMNGNTVLTGGGPIVMTDNAGNTIEAVSAAMTLTNVSSTISGAGNLGNGNLNFTNDAAGVVDATGASSQLRIDTAGQTLTNLGLIEATGAAGAVIISTLIDDTGGGTISATTGSAVYLQSSTIAGGTLATSGTGFIATASSDRGSVLDGTNKAMNVTGVLDVTNNAYLYVQGTINNTGTINVQSGGNDTRLRMNANTTLAGGGPIVLSDNISNTIDAGVSGSSLTNLSSTISGAGLIGGNGLILINAKAGTVNASGGNTLTLATSNTVTNSGLIEATGAGGMLIRSTAVNDSTGGVISASAGSAVVLQASTIIGGAVASSGTGVIETAGSDRSSVLDGATAPMTLTATVDVTNNAYLYIQGMIDNTGTINVQSGGNDTRLRMNANTVLTGGGAIVLSDNGNNTLDAGVSGSSLTNVSSTISGAGTIGGNGFVLINDAAGVVNANGANTLVLATSNTVANSGLIEATGAGGLLIRSTAVDGSTGGTISAGNGATVTLQSSTIVGGILSSTGTGAFQINDRGSTLDGTTSMVTNAATFNVTNNNWLYIQGTINNTGSINVNSAGNDTRLRLNANTTLTGNGVVLLNGNPNNTFEGDASGLTLTNNGNTLEGFGNLFSGINLIFVNGKGGVVDGNSATALVLSTGANTITNAGTLEGTGAGGLVIANAKIIGTGGTVLAAAGSTVTLQSSTLTGGSMSVVATGEIVVGNGSTATLDSFASDAGTIFVDSTSAVTSLIIDKSTSLTGGGVLQLSANKNNVVGATKTTITLTNVNDVIEGGGKLGNNKMILVNDATGTIDANTAVPLVIGTQKNTITNAGLIEATNKGRATITSAVANTGTLAAAGGTLTVTAAVTGTGVATINAGTLIFGSSFSENVAFTGATGKLELAQSQTYTGQISGFSLKGKTSLDLKDIGFVSANEATFSGTKTGGVLTVTDGVHTAQINLVGNYTSSTFVASSDGGTGVIIVDPTAPTPTIHTMAAAMAGLGATASAGGVHQSHSNGALLPLVASPQHKV